MGGLPRAGGLLFTALTAAVAAACASAPAAAARDAPGARVLPTIVRGAEWRAEPAEGHVADGLRRNLAPGDTLRLPGFAAIAVGAGEVLDGPDTARLILRAGDQRAERTVAEGAAVRWGDHRVAVLAVRADPGELGAGRVELEVAPLDALPPDLASSESAGGADMRIRIPHRITHVTLHHSGSPEPLRPEDDPVEKLRGLQRWGRTDRNWWDVPYHFLIDLEGRVYEGRDWRYMGETNTEYDPRGHLLISVLGNYALQEPTPAQLESIAGLMAWAVAEFGIPVERIGGHYDHASTSCPGTHLRRYLEDGTFRRAVEARLSRGGDAGRSRRR